MRKKEEGRHTSQRGRVQELLLKVLGIVVLAVLLGGIVLITAKVIIPVASMYRSAVQKVDDSSKDTFRAEETSIIYDTNGNEIKKLKGEKDVYYVSYSDIPDAAKLAIISVEDKNFATHRGIDLEGITRAVISLIRNRGTITQGGSTITQQLARNVFLNFDQSYSRKVEEMFIAMALEYKYSKQEILEFYLNNVYFANGYYGIEAASQAYFGKSSSDLTIAQCAFLCAIPNAPTRYDPYKNAEDTMTRRDKILKNMHEEGYIDDEQYETSLSEDITVLKKKETDTNNYAETYIIRCATEALMQAEGFELQDEFSTEAQEEEYSKNYSEAYQNCNQKLYTGGYRIYTSIDMLKQQELQNAVSSQLSDFTNKTDDGVYEVQGAAVSIDNSTGRVVAIVGGREEDQEGYGLNRAYQSFRQPGSAIKPLLVYAPSFENGYTPDSILDDSRMTGEDAVSNADGYSGSITLRRAVEKSSNVATYRLYQELGPEKCLKYLEQMSFIGLEEEDYEYDTTCLGGFTKGATVLEMAAGYAALANDGQYRTPTCIEKITDASNKTVVSEDYQEEKRIYTRRSARMMTSVLESCVTSSSATAHNCKLDVKDMPAACKTGTTSSYVDGWLCGYTPYYTTAVWVGRDTMKTVDNLKGNTYPAYIWKDYMDVIHQNLEATEFPSWADDSSYDFSTTATTEDTEDTEETSVQDTEEDSDSYDDDSNGYDDSNVNDNSENSGENDDGEEGYSDDDSENSDENEYDPYSSGYDFSEDNY